MKKLLIAAAVTALLATPAFADDDHHSNNNGNFNLSVAGLSGVQNETLTQVQTGPSAPCGCANVAIAGSLSAAGASNSGGAWATPTSVGGFTNSQTGQLNVVGGFSQGNAASASALGSMQLGEGMFSADLTGNLDGHH